MNKSALIIDSNYFGFTKILAVAAATLVICMPAASQEAASERNSIFEEIVVTAQKREENIMEVPVAVTAVTGAQIQASGIKDMFDLQQNVPSMIVNQSQTSTTSAFSIRSVGSTSNNFGVESSVGLYVDGVYRSRQSSMMNDLVDVDAVEILRGPQGTLFGKNTSSGAISIRTVRPGQERDGFIDLTAGDYGLMKISAAANIPINDSMAFRATVSATERDGFVTDVAYGDDKLNDRSRWGTRFQLAKDSDKFNWLVIADYSEIDETCCVALSSTDYLYSQVSLSPPPPSPGTDAALLQFGGTIFTDYPYPQPYLDALAPLPGTVVPGVGFDKFTTALNELPQSKNTDSGLSFEFNYDFDGGATLTSISAYRAFDTYDYIDGDFTNVGLFDRINDAEQSSFSQELRLGGEFGNGSHYVVGAYYFGQQITNTKSTSDAMFLSTYLNANPAFVRIGNNVDFLSTLFGGLGYLPAGTPVLPGAWAVDDVTQDHSGYAAFAQVDYAVSDRWTVTLGARYTDETKDIDAKYTQSLPTDTPRPSFGAITYQLCLLDPANSCQLPPGTPPFNPVTALPVFQPFFVDGWGTFRFDPLAPRPDYKDSVQDDQVTGTAKLTFFPSDSTMLYALYATGYKAGGTNDDRVDPAFDVIFGPESSESIEIGFKGDLGPFRLAVALYDTQYEDFQANSFTGTGFNLQNAGDLDTHGVEIEVLWRPLENTEVQAFYSLNKGEFKSFEKGTCQDAYQIHTGLPDPGLPPGLNPVLDPEVCDRSGDPLPYNPENKFFLALTQDIPMGNNVLFFRGEYSYASELYTDGDVDPFTLQDAVSMVNLRIGYEWIDWNANLTLWGRNITDERYFHGSFDAPAQTGRVNSYPSDPATYGITFRKGFD